MSDQGGAESLPPVSQPPAQGGGEAGGPRQEINVDSAQDCLKQLKEIARQQGRSFGLADLRKVDIDELFAPGDPQQNKEPGMLNKAGWQDDQQTKDFLANTQRYAEKQAEIWLNKIQTELKLSPEQLADKSFDELKGLALKAGMAVDETVADPKKKAEAEETLDNLRNAWEKAKEKAMSGSKDKEDTARALADETEALSLIEGDLKNLTPESQGIIMNIIAHGADKPQVYIKQGEILAQATLGEKDIDTFLGKEESPENQKPDFERRKHNLALALDLQIAGLQEQLGQLKGKKRENIENMIKILREKRNKLRTTNEKGENVVIPDQIKSFAAIFNCENLEGVRVVLERAASSPEQRKALLNYIDTIGLDRATVEKVFTKIHRQQEARKWKDRGKTAGVLALLLALLLAWQASKHKGGGEGMMG